MASSLTQNLTHSSDNFLKDLLKNIKSLKHLDTEFQKKQRQLIEIVKEKFSPKNPKENQTLDTSKDKNLFENCLQILDHKADITNHAYFEIEDKIKHIKNVLNELEQEKINLKFNEFINKNIGQDRNIDELIDFDNFLKSKKKSRSKKNRSAMRNLNLNVNISSNNLKKRKMKKIKGINTVNNSSKKKTGEESIVNYNCNFDLQNYEDITYAEIAGLLNPNEQIYCFCNYISYGNMVKCDNTSCPKEWFHFNCVGLKNLPKGKWFCSSRCANQANYKEKNVKKNMKN